MIDQIMHRYATADAAKREAIASFWKYLFFMFETPRPPSKEAGVRNKIIEKIAKPLGLEYKVDTIGNLLIRKPATPGFENRVRVAIQGHLDMVCTSSGGQFDFENTPITVFISDDGKWVQARGTTLGADDGVGVAAGLAMLEDDTIQHGPLECLFTIEEETTMNGAIEIAPAPFLQAQALLNVDSEEEHKICVGCAGGAEARLYLPVTRLTQAEYATAAADLQVVTLNLTGLVGGHTGIDIHRGRANAIQGVARFLREAIEAAKGDADAVRLIEFTNKTNARNAIPSYLKATVVIRKDAQFGSNFEADGKLRRPKDPVVSPLAGFEGFKKVVQSYYYAYRAEHKVAEDAGRSPDSEVHDSNLDITLEPSESTVGSAEWRASHVPLTSQSTQAFLGLAVNIPDGVIRYSPDVPGAVDTSNSLSVVNLEPNFTPTEGTETKQSKASLFGNCPEDGPNEDCAYFHCFYRSFSDYQLREFGIRLRELGKLAGAYSTSPFNYFSGWEPVMSSKLLQATVQAHQRLFPDLPEPEVYSVHAGLECGCIKQQYPDLHAVSIGPYIRGAHSPDEKLLIETVDPYYSWVRETLAELGKVPASEF